MQHTEPCKEAADAVVKHHEKLLAMARRECAGDSAVAHDVVQSAIAMVLARAPKLKALKDWLGYLVVSLKNRIYTRHRRRKPSVGLVEELPDHRLTGVDAHVSREERHEAIRSAVAGLPEEQKRVIVMRYFDGKKTADIAGELGISERTVRDHLQKGIQSLKERLDAWQTYQI